MLINPRETVTAASGGLELWWTVVVPALLPFFIIAELLVNLGFVGFLGILLEPVMRPLFRLPGCSSLVVAMGFTSGFPVGAILTRRLYDDGLLTAEEAEHLVSFTNNSSPLFIMGAVGVGMFGSQSLGVLLAVSHYVANLLVGLLWRFKALDYYPSTSSTRVSLLSQAFSFLHTYHRDNKPGAGQVLSEAIHKSIRNILAIAGFIIIFSVLTRMLTVWGLLTTLALALNRLGSFLGITYQLAYGLSMGLFEITIGARTITGVSPSLLLPQLLAVSAVLGFSGFSIIAQVMGIMGGTPVRLSFYLLSRLLQVIFSLLITLLGFTLMAGQGIAIPSAASPAHTILYSIDAWSYSLVAFAAGLIFIGIVTFAAVLAKSKGDH